MTTSITSTRAAAAIAVLFLALALQVSVFPHLAFRGVVPDLVPARRGRGRAALRLRAPR